MSVSTDYQNLEEAKLMNAMKSSPVYYFVQFLHTAQHHLSEAESVV